MVAMTRGFTASQPAIAVSICKKVAREPCRRSILTTGLLRAVSARKSRGWNLHALDYHWRHRISRDSPSRRTPTGEWNVYPADPAAVRSDHSHTEGACTHRH